MRNTIQAAQGKWRGILLQLGIEDRFLRNKHGPCPLCAGTDRYRWDNREGTGSYICSHCGAGNGMGLLQAIKGWDFKQAADEVDAVIGNVRQPDKVRPPMDAEKRRRMLNDVWKAGKRVTLDDPAGRYLTGRGLDLPQNSDALRFVERCPVHGGGEARWAMVAMITGPNGKPVNLHRTFLGPNGKADMDQPRATMPGEIPEGSAIRLSLHGERLGIAEGIETALAAGMQFGLPVWAAVNSTMLAKWTPPDTVREVLIFGDNDPKFGGQAAAWKLAHRLAVKGIAVEAPHIPADAGTDWADRLTKRLHLPG